MSKKEVILETPIMFLDESSCLFGQIGYPPKFRVCHNLAKKGQKVVILWVKIGCTLPGVLRELTRNQVVGPVLTVFRYPKMGPFWGHI